MNVDIKIGDILINKSNSKDYEIVLVLTKPDKLHRFYSLCTMPNDFKTTFLLYEIDLIDVVQNAWYDCKVR